MLNFSPKIRLGMLIHDMLMKIIKKTCSTAILSLFKLHLQFFEAIAFVYSMLIRYLMQ